MMSRGLFLGLFLLFFASFPGFSQLPPIGNWRDHLPYHQAIAVTGNDRLIWCATPYSIFKVDLQDHSLTRWSKVIGLNEAGIRTIALDPVSGQLLIAYNSSNIDILSGATVTNINALQEAPVSGDKTINGVFINEGKAYLATGIGIVVTDLSKYEIKDTYVIGDSGHIAKVNAVTGDGNNLYAATEEGLKSASLHAANLADFRSWQLLSGNNGLPAGAVEQAVVLNGQIVALKQDSLFILKDGNWTFLYADGTAIHHIDSSPDRLLLSESQAGSVVVLDETGRVIQVVRDPAYTASPQAAVFVNDAYWIADATVGLSAFSGGSFEPFVPNSPLSVATGEMAVYKNNLWAAAGSIGDNRIPQNNKDGLFLFSGNNWTALNRQSIPALDTLPDLVTLAIDPQDESIWAGSFGGGLVHIRKDNTATVYKQDSPLQPALSGSGSYRIGGLALDAGDNLWIANDGAPAELLVRKADGNWQSFTVPFSISQNAVSQVCIDDMGQLWIVSPGNGLLCFNDGQTIDNPGDDQWKWYRSGQGNGNLPDNDVLCIAKDKSGFMWTGTTKGIGIIQCPQAVFSTEGCDALLPVVQQDNFAGYLFQDEQVQAIAVDGADRKWVGTRNGLWLLSPGGDRVIYRFTTGNSPLPDNHVRQITIDGQTGEVFVATDRGLCSFRSTATEGGETNSNVLVFPNPVPPGYTGTIAIRGLVANAIVKITELNGRLVYQTRALGGQAIWNGKDYTGHTVSTGVYLVLVSDDSRQQKIVTKIVFVKK